MKETTVEPGIYHIIEYSITGVPVYTQEVREVKRSIKGKIVEETDGILNVRIWDGTILEV